MELELSKSKELYERAIKVIPGAANTMSKRPEALAKGAMPMFIKKGKGCYVWDVDGNKYLDYIGALGPVTLGYSYSAVNEAVKEQLEDGIIFSMSHPLEVEAANAIIDAVPCAEMVRFLKTGAEATSAAVRIARAYTGKELIVNSGYHGWLDTWMAERDDPMDRGVPKALKNSIASFTFGDIDSLNKVMNEHKGEVACILMEPVSYADMNTKDFLQSARKLADENGVVLIFDEIVSGFRVSLGGAQEYFGVTPDIACFAKGISNGLPLAAVAGKKEIMLATKDITISSTYAGDALALAAVVACIKEYKDKDVFTHTRKMGEMLVSGLNKAASDIGLKLEFIGYPQMSMYSFDYGDVDVNTDLTTLFMQEMAKRGFLFRRGGLVCITYSHTKDDIDKTIATCSEIFPKLLSAYNDGKVKDLLEVKEVAKSVRKF